MELTQIAKHMLLLICENVSSVTQIRYKPYNAPTTLTATDHGNSLNSLAILVVLEEMTAHLSQRIFAVAPDQALLQLLSILPDFVCKVEKRMSSSTGQRLNRDQVLLMIRTQAIISNVNERSGEEGGILGTLLLPILEIPGSLTGNVTPREVLKGVGVGRKADVVAGIGETMQEKWLTTKKKMDKLQAAMMATKNPTALEEATRSATVVARSATKRRDAPYRFVVSVAERTIQPKPAPTWSLSLRAKLTLMIATGTRFSTEKSL